MVTTTVMKTRFMNIEATDKELFSEWFWEQFINTEEINKILHFIILIW